MGDFDIKQFKKMGINISSLMKKGGGAKLSDKMSSEQVEVFKRLDKNNDGVVSQQEFLNFANDADASGKGKLMNDGNVNFSESKNYFMSEISDKNVIKQLTPEEIVAFFEEFSNDGTPEDIKNATETIVDGKKATTIEYNNGDKEIIFEDGSKKIIQKNSKDEIIATEKRADGTIEREIINNTIGQITENIYEQDGKTLQEVKTNDSKTNKLSVTTYENGKPISKEVTHGTSSLKYKYDSNNNEIIISKTIDKGSGLIEQTTYEYSQNGEIKETITSPNGKLITVKNEFGNITFEAIEDSNGNVKTTDFKTNGAKTVKEDKSTGLKRTTEYNNNGFKTSETTTINGNEYKATFDGKGHGLLVLKAGESFEAFSKRTGVPMEELSKLNDTSKMPKAGQKVIVPDSFIKSTDFNNYGISHKMEKNKGDIAETKLNNEINKFSEIESIKRDKTYGSYENYAKELLIKSGNTNPNEQLIKKLSSKIKSMNNGAPIDSLEKIKTIITSDMKTKIVEEQKALERKNIIAKQNALKKEGGAIAKNIYDSITGAGTDISKLDNNLSKITKDNAADVIIQYKNFSEEGICEAINDEIGITRTVQNKYLDVIFNKLEIKAKELGMDVSQLHEEWSDLDKTGFNNSKMDKIVNQLATKIKFVENIPQSERDTTSSKSIEKYTINALREIYNNSLRSFKGLDANGNKLVNEADGWAGEVADWIGENINTRFKINDKKNYKAAVSQDLKVFREQYEELQKAEKEGKLKEKFKEIYGTDYNPTLIKAYQKYQSQIPIVESIHAIETKFNNDFADLIKNEHMTTGQFQMGYEYKIYKELVDFCGGGKDGEALLKQRLKDLGYNGSNLYETMHKFAKGQSKALNQATKKATGGLSYNEFSFMADNAFKAAFGSKNDIAQRVENYNISQLAGANAIKTTSKVGIVALTAVAVTLTGGTATPFILASTAAGASIAIDSSDIYTSETRTFTSEAIVNMLETAGLDAALTYSGAKLGSLLKNANAFSKIPGAKMTVSVVGNTAIGATGQYVKEGTVTIDGVLINVLFSATGEVISLKCSNLDNIGKTTIKQINKLAKTETKVEVKNEKNNS